MSTGPEWEKVEAPFLNQLDALDWKVRTGNPAHPSATGRETFGQVLLEQDLAGALRKINLRDGEPWLDDGRISQAISALTRITYRSLMEANQKATRLLLEGATVDGVEGWNEGRAQTVHFIDWENPGNNTFMAFNQFRVDEASVQSKEYIEPDIVLFINGIPVVVVECKAPLDAGVKSGDQTARREIVQAVDQLRRYSNQRERYQQSEGNEALFHTVQLLVATCFEEARIGTIGAPVRHFKEWKDTSPAPMSEVADALGVDELSSQQRLIAGALRPAHLLDIIRHFTLFMQDEDGRTIKAVCRYQQFRAVHLALHRLQHGGRRSQGAPSDQRGGIIWHTQGSGKSLTMVFLIRKMVSMPAFQPYKIVLVTDRTDLQRQLSETAELTGESVKVAKKVRQLSPLLSNDTPDIVFAMIQKYQDLEEDKTEEEGSFPILNEREEILVLVDEAHRSHGSNARQGNFGTLHTNLRQALPNCAMIGLTGTPILMGQKKRTHEIFGAFIDKYTIRQAEEDGATLPILYEGRTANAELKDGESLDSVFADFFKGLSEAELEALKAKYATKGNVLEAEELIREKSEDMLAHFVDNILPNGFKAQVVAYSRRAAVRYQQAFLTARDKLVGEIEGLDPYLLALTASERETLDERSQQLLRARPHVRLLRALEFAVVISGTNNDDPSWAEWTDARKNDRRVKRFKRPLGSVDSKKSSPLAFLIVKSMLLTGFDAKVEQALYLDRPIREAELLQAIARVNRSGPAKKMVGIVVDYYGVARHLDEALHAYYDAEDIEGALKSLADDLPKLRDAHRAALATLTARGLDPQDQEAGVQALSDEKLRGGFEVSLKRFLSALDTVLPRPEARPFVPDAKLLAEIFAETKRRYRVGGSPAVDPEDGAKVAALLDEHLQSKGIDPKIPPVSILDPNFSVHIRSMGSDRARASEMEHAARYHIRLRSKEDPVRYRALSERLEAIIAELDGNWSALVKALESFLSNLKGGPAEMPGGLDPRTEVPFLRLVSDGALRQPLPPEESLARFCALTLELVTHIRQEISRVDFWQNAHAQKVLRGELYRLLDDADLVPYERLDPLADQLMELARELRQHLGRTS